MTSVSALLAALMLLPGCTSGNDASIPQAGGFELVSPGGATEFSYPIADRKPLGEISGPALVGDGRVSLADYPDTVIVINFWGSWCGPCRAEAPYLATAAADLKDKGVQFIGVDSRERNRQDGVDFDALRGSPYPSIYDQGLQILQAIRGYPIAGIPSTIVLDRQHRVAHIWLKELNSPADLVAVVGQIAAEPTTSTAASSQPSSPSPSQGSAQSSVQSSVHSSARSSGQG